MSMYSRSYEVLFNRDSLQELIGITKAQLVHEVQSDEAYLRPQNMSHRDFLIKNHRIHIPQILGYKAKVAGERIEYAVSFSASDGSFFHLKPTLPEQLEKLTAEVISNTLYLHIPKSGDIESMKREWENLYGNFMMVFNLVKDEAEKYNAKVPELVDQAFESHQNKLASDKALEDELNAQ